MAEIKKKVKTAAQKAKEAAKRKAEQLIRIMIGGNRF